MLKKHVKFENLEDEFTDLQDILKNSLQKEILTIKQLNKDGIKFKQISEKKPELLHAEYVVFSMYMCKDYHASETFIFIDAKGKNICKISGREMDLYDMIKDCEHLIEAKPY